MHPFHMLGEFCASPSVQNFNNYGAFVFITLAKTQGFFGEPTAHTSVSEADLDVFMPENIDIRVRRHETRLNGENFFTVSCCPPNQPYKQSSSRLFCNGSSSGDLSGSAEDNPVPEPIPPRQLPGIYVIICLENNKRYYGVSVNVSRRLSQHKSRLRRGLHEIKAMQDDYNLYGEEKFKFGAISHSLQQTALERESAESQLINDFIAIYSKDSCYNTFANSFRKKEANPFFGKQHTEETKKRMSDTAKETREQRPPEGLPIVLKGVVYPSISEASRMTSHSRDTIRRWLNDPNNTKCVYLNPDQQPNTNSNSRESKKSEDSLSKNTGLPKRVSIRGDIYPSIAAAAYAMGCSRAYIQKLLRTDSDCFIIEE